MCRETLVLQYFMVLMCPIFHRMHHIELCSYGKCAAHMILWLLWYCVLQKTNKQSIYFYWFLPPKNEAWKWNVGIILVEFFSVGGESERGISFNYILGIMLTVFENKENARMPRVLDGGRPLRSQDYLYPYAQIRSETEDMLLQTQGFPCFTIILVNLKYF